MTGSVFISHSSKDARIAHAICTALENRGVTCWMASRNVGPGENFQESIVRAIRTAKVMVLVFTDNANNSHEIKKELALASQYNKTVIPARAEDVLPDDALSYEFATRNWINLFEDWEHGIERLSAWIAGIVSFEASGSGPVRRPPTADTTPLPLPDAEAQTTPAPLPLAWEAKAEPPPDRLRSDKLSTDQAPKPAAPETVATPVAMASGSNEGRYEALLAHPLRLYVGSFLMLVAGMAVILMGFVEGSDPAPLFLLIAIVVGVVAISPSAERAWAVVLQAIYSLFALLPLGLLIANLSNRNQPFLLGAICVLFAGFAATVAFYLGGWRRQPPAFTRRPATFGTFLLLTNVTCATLIYALIIQANKGGGWIVALIVITGALSTWAYFKFTSVVARLTDTRTAQPAEADSKF